MRYLLVILLFWLVAAPARAQASGDVCVDSLLAQMTTEEKLGQLVQYSGRWAVTGLTVPQGSNDEIRAGRVGSFLNIHGAEATCQIQRIAVEESRLGIPLLFAHDVIHNFRTIFPVPLAEAAAFDPALAEQTARIAAREASAAGLYWTFAPMVDVAWDARWGRIVEGAGEDPYLGSVLAAARVRGFQGPTLASLAADSTLLATAKHFVAYGAAEGGRDYNTTDMSERTLREVYLAPFKAAVDADVQSLMTGFNEIGGVPATGNRWLFTDILHDEWGFDGIVVSDYTAVWELIHHGVAADSADAGRLALGSGIDVNMVDGIYVKNLVPLVESGTVPTGLLDEAVRRVLRAKHHVGLFDDPYRYCESGREETSILTDIHRALARKAGHRSIVLLKNEGGVLPLAKDLGSVAVIGALAADSVSALGSWAGAGRREETTPILAGIRRALPNADVRFARGYPAIPDGSFEEKVAAALSTDRSGRDEAVALAEEADAAVLVLGEHRELMGEATSRADIGLPGAQMELARRVIEAAGEKPVVVVLTNGRPLAIPELAQLEPAILETWHLGTEMGPAVADVLFNDVNPGGKLPVTFPRATGQEPMYYNAKNTGRPPNPTSKYNSKWIDVDWTPLYPFGHGLSYTTFEYSPFVCVSPIYPPLEDGTLIDEVDCEDDTSVPLTGGAVEVQVEVRNTGDRAGAEVVQLYIRDEVASVTRPVQELKGFERIELQPGERKLVRFILRPEDLQFWGPEGGWTVEPGWFTVMVGTSAADTHSARFELTD